MLSSKRLFLFILCILWTQTRPAEELQGVRREGEAGAVEAGAAEEWLQVRPGGELGGLFLAGAGAEADEVFPIGVFPGAGRHRLRF